jgi:DNA polymerase-3 subunit alpha
MTKPEFMSLHTHTHNSMLDGFSKTMEYLDRAEKLNQPGIGISDHGNLFGVYDLIQGARARDMIGVPGCEFYVAPINPEGAQKKGPVFYGPGGQKAERNDVSSNGAYLHMTVWAYNNVGLQNLFKLSTLSFRPENVYQKPRIDFTMLTEHSEGLIVATGCPSSEISTRFLLGQDDKAYEYARRLKDVFGDRLFVEIMDHNMSISLERDLLPKQLELSKKLSIPLLATNDSHYAHPHDAIHHEEMLCLQSGAFMDSPTWDEGGNRFAFQGDQYYLKSSEEMAAIFPEADFPGALKSSLVIAEMTQEITLDFNPHLRPKPQIPPAFADEVEYYKHLLEEGFQRRYGSFSADVQEEARRRISHEFQVIHSSDFVGYMLTVREYLVWTRETYSTRNEQGEILALSIGVGRGSVGGSIHAYLLDISEVDPIEHDLIFERFLSAGRGATYRIVYSDGTSEEIVVSDEKQVRNAAGELEHKYVHQLQPGDIIVD